MIRANVGPLAADVEASRRDAAGDEQRRDRQIGARARVDAAAPSVRRPMRASARRRPRAARGAPLRVRSRASRMTLCATVTPCLRTMCESGHVREEGEEHVERDRRSGVVERRAARPRRGPRLEDVAKAVRVLARDAVAVGRERHRGAQVDARLACTDCSRRVAEAARVRQRDRAIGGAGVVEVEASSTRSAAARHARASRGGVSSSSAAASGAHSSTMPRLVLQPAAVAACASRASMRAPTACAALEQRARRRLGAGDELRGRHAVPGAADADVARLRRLDVELRRRAGRPRARSASAACIAARQRDRRARARELAVEQVVDERGGDVEPRHRLQPVPRRDAVDFDHERLAAPPPSARRAESGRRPRSRGRAPASRASAVSASGVGRERRLAARALRDVVDPARPPTRRIAATARPPITSTRQSKPGRSRRRRSAAGTPRRRRRASDGSGAMHAADAAPSRRKPLPCEPNSGFSTSAAAGRRLRASATRCANAADSPAQVGGVGTPRRCSSKLVIDLSTLRSIARASL